MSQSVKAFLVSGLCCEISFFIGFGVGVLQLRKSEEHRRTLYEYCPSLLESYYWIENFAQGNLYGSKLKHSDLNNWVRKADLENSKHIPISD